MFETIFFLMALLAILYVIFWAIINDEGQTEWWEKYKDTSQKDENKAE